MAINTATQFNVATRHGVIFQSNNSDLQTASTFATRPNKGYFVEFKVVAIRADTFEQAGTWWRQACFRNDGGTLTQVGATRTIGTDNEDAAGWIVEVDSSGTTIRIRVAGEGSPVNWLIESNIQEIDAIPLT